jgi:transcriptional regulator with XRE-family HTH domain
MKIDSQLSDEAVLAELGRRLARTRLERNLTQATLGDEAGVGLATVQRIESGRPVKTTSLARVLRALGLLDALDQLVPEPAPSPLERLKLQGKERRRAAGSRAAGAPAAVKQPWQWGDEQGGNG